MHVAVLMMVIVVAILMVIIVDHVDGNDDNLMGGFQGSQAFLLSF